MTEPTGARILVIDDELQIRRFLRISLSSQGYKVLEAENGARGLELAATDNPDLIVLDLGLPDADGKDILAEIRTWSHVPVVVLSVRASEAEKVMALDRGANDYVTKPFGVQEFLARVRSLLRVKEGPAESAVFDDGNLRIDLGSRRIRLRGEDVHLAPKEYRILRQLMLNAGRVITQTQLLKDNWGPAHAGDSHYLRIVIGKIRNKLGDDPEHPRYIETEPGVGYRFLG
jgi:two-component system KDP operon response regulator KdpE